VSAVCHHGGAGTIAAGLRAGKPTIVVPFFGDQFFWGNIIEKSGAGPRPLPGKSITVDELAEAFRFVHQSTTRIAAENIREAMAKENGCQAAVRAFHAHLPLTRMRSDLESTFAACYRVDGLDIQISRPVAHVLLSAGVIDVTQLHSHYTRQWKTSHHHITISDLHTQKSSSSSIVYNNIGLRRTKSTEHLSMHEHDGKESIDHSFQQNIDHQTIDCLSSYDKKTDKSDRVSSLYNSSR
jgi:hypothetical protein